MIRRITENWRELVPLNSTNSYKKNDDSYFNEGQRSSEGRYFLRSV
jgi:hypothetical protein